MGQRHREKRKQIKARLAEVIKLDDHRTFENEFGELKKRMTKAEARRRLLFRRTISIESVEELLRAYGKQAAEEILLEMGQRALKDIQEEEDQRVFSMIDQCVNEATVDYVHDL